MSQIEFKFVELETVEDTEPIFASDNVHYDFLTGGYIKPEKLLTCPIQIEEVKAAAKLVERFLDEALEKDLIGVI